MSENNGLLTFGGHLEVLRRMLFRVIAVAAVFAIGIFCFKTEVFNFLLAPSEWDFVTYRWMESVLLSVGFDFHFEQYHVNLIATDLSSQFMTHITTACYLALVATSPYILYELFAFVAPALYDNEKRYSVVIVVLVYLLFFLGLLMSYYVIFPIAFRFLGTYSVDARVVSNITLDSYIDTFVTLALVMGLVFQLPIIAFVLGKMGIVKAEMLSKYRRHAILAIGLVSAIITPPDLLSMVLVTLPLYLLYEISIKVVRLVERIN